MRRKFDLEKKIHYKKEVLLRKKTSILGRELCYRKKSLIFGKEVL